MSLSRFIGFFDGKLPNLYVVWNIFCCLQMDNEGDHNEADVSTKDDNAAEAPGESVSILNFEVVHVLSEKFLQLFEPDLKRITDKLNDVTQNQTVLIESLSQEKNKLSKCSAIDEIECAMTKINLYRSKLNTIKKTMAALKEHSNRY